MRAAVYRAPGALAVERREVPEPGPGEVRVRVAVCGVCGTDASEVFHGPVQSRPPVVLGHEYVGTVDALGDGVTDLAVGATVVCGAGVSCGECKPCLAGRTNLCRSYRTSGLQFDGGLAEFVTVPASVLLDVTDTGLPVDTLALAQPLAIAVHAVRRSGLRAGQDAVLVGAGGIGAFMTIAAAATGARLLVVDLDPDRLDLAQRLGAQHVARAGEVALSERIAQLGMDVDVFFEVSGSRAGLGSVLEAARPGATIVPVGIQHGAVEVELSSWTIREFTVIGTNAHVFATDIPDAVRLLAARDDWGLLAPEVLPLDEVVEGALRPLSEGRSTRIKTLIDPRASEPRAAVHA
jgi:(R,R)-butanediol dehydrogenase / meso-butanediol dehydrogenase / diacetyl reductase